MEEWKDIEGYEGLYQVNNTGKVRSLNYNRTGEVRELKQTLANTGYYVVNLSNKTFLVHRLVAKAFIPNTENLPEVNHKSEIKTDNRVENLEWCNKVYNINYGTRNDRARKANSKAVLQFTKDGRFIREWESTMSVENTLGVSNSNISKVCNGERNTAGGYKWKYK